MFTRRLFNSPGFGWTPFSEFDRMRRQMDALSELFLRGAQTGKDLPAGVFPLINLSESKESFHLRAELPGMKADDLDIQVTGRNLTISGERKIPSEGDHVKYHRSEREAGKFSRVIGLPGDINPGGVEAKMQHGLLTITIPKSEAAKPRQITVR